jgi:hypothetical protein
MNYTPTILFNPTNRIIEFMYDHQSYKFQPGEKKLLDGLVADHALRDMNTGLKIYVPETDDSAVSSTNVAYDKMPWKQVVSLASARGIFKPGMSKTAVLKALAETDVKGN